MEWSLELPNTDGYATSPQLNIEYPRTLQPFFKGSVDFGSLVGSNDAAIITDVACE